MSIFYRIIIVLLIIVAGYSLYGIGHFKWLYYKVNNPKAEFQVAGNLNSNITFVEFINYTCGYCRDLNPVIKELLEVRKDIRYVARPVSFDIYVEEKNAQEGTPPKKIEDKITKIILAAGLQDKFWEMHDAVLGYPEGEIPDDFIKETANLYGIDYDQLITDSNSKKIQKIIAENLKVFNYAGLYSVPSFMMNGKIYSVTEESLPDLKALLNFLTIAEQP